MEFGQAPDNLPQLEVATEQANAGDTTEITINAQLFFTNQR